VAGLADRIAIMERGRIVESGETVSVFDTMAHPYTRKLFAASGHIPVRKRANGGAPLLEVVAVTRDYPLPRRLPFGPRPKFRAVDGVSLTVSRGENIGLVGESGCGKSTLARAILGLEPVQAGAISLDGDAVNRPQGPRFATRRKMQIVFQDPYGSFNPRHTVARLVSEPFHLMREKAPKGAEREAQVVGALEMVGLTAADAERYIHEFSGGQRQRIAIARALITHPDLIVLDEAVSALDVSIRAQILDLLASLSDRLGLSYLFISHDLNVVRAITDRVLVMKSGQIVEEGATEAIFSAPRHPYTKALIAAAPNLEQALALRRKAIV
jgi:peptide/nickel transport system ATP-binding protein